MKYTPSLLSLLLATSVPAMAESDTLSERLVQLENELKEVRQQLKNTAPSPSENPVKIGGAVRFQYALKDYDEDDKDRGGDLDFDVFRIDFNSQVGDVKLSAQYRWYQYMDVVHHAYLGYDFNEQWEGRIGITQVPFGILSFNSNSYFFSTNYYVGLEDDYDAGITLTGKFDNHDLRLAFFKTDEMGGLDGFVTDRTGRYSYDIVGTRDINSEGIYDTPAEGLADSNTLNIRYAYQLDNTEIGVSLLYGGLEGESGSAGEHTAYALHVKSQIDKIGIMFQYTDYEYDLDEQSDFVTVGAYSFYDSIPAAADLYNLNVSYSLPVSIGPINHLKFYNDFNIMTNKSGDLEEDTVMNVTGVEVTSGNLYTLIDFAIGKNQPFLGGSLAGDSDEWNKRFNINFGYYF